MSIFNKTNKKGGFMDEIRCDEPSYLIWRWHPSGVRVGTSNRENAIRWGSSLRVKDGETAVFVYNQKNGKMQDFIEGPFDGILKTNNLPILASIVGLAYEGGTPFQAEVYFINTAQIIQTKFAVPYFDVFDPRLDDFGVPVAVRDTLSFKISDYRQFIKLHRLNDFSLREFQNEIAHAVSRYVKDVVANAPAQNDIPLVQIESKIAQMNDVIELYLKDRLEEGFGVTVSGVDIGAIDVDKSSDEYRQLMAVTKEHSSATIRAQTAADIKNIHDKQRIEAENYEQTLRYQREEAQYAQHKATQSANLGAFQTEKQAEVGIAGAQALGHMGENGADSINLSSGGGDGINMAGLMASMAVGGAVGQNIAGTMNSMMSGANPTNIQQTPPPIPTVAYHVAVNGQPTGPFDLATLTQMAAQGTLTKQSLVWKSGMASWQSAETVDELRALFGEGMPPIK